MAGQFFRAPGAKVTYNSYQTREYVSRKARVSRGLYITPARRDRTPDGWRFWFASLRGPAADRGNWKVEAVRVSSDGDGGDGGGSPLPACPPAGTVLNHTWVGWHYLDFDFTLPPPYYTTGSGSGTMPRSVAQSISPPGSEVGEAGGYSDGPFFYAPWYWFSDDGDSGWAGETVYYYGTDPDVDLTAEWEAWKGDDRYVTPGFVLTNVSGGGYNFSDPNGLPVPYCDDGSTPPPDPDPGGGGALPEGFLPGAGPWAYACSCPDFTGEESRYQVATAPSHRRSRSWGQIRPESPCKHIAAAAKALGDQKTLVKWVRTFKDDSPGSEFSRSPTVIIDRTYRNEQRRLNAAFAKTVRNQRKATAALKRQQRAERSALRLSERLGRVHRIDRDGRTISSDIMGRFGQSLHIANSPALERIRRGTSQTYDQGNQAIYTMPKLAPRQPLVTPTPTQMAADPRFWSASDVAYQIGYEARSLVRPNHAPTAATLYVGGSGPALGSRNNRSIRIPNPDQSPGAQDSILIPGTRANSRLYGVSLR